MNARPKNISPIDDTGLTLGGTVNEMCFDRVVDRFTKAKQYLLNDTTSGNITSYIITYMPGKEVPTDFLCLPTLDEKSDKRTARLSHAEWPLLKGKHLGVPAAVQQRRSVEWMSLEMRIWSAIDTRRPSSSR